MSFLVTLFYFILFPLLNSIGKFLFVLYIGLIAQIVLKCLYNDGESMACMPNVASHNILGDTLAFTYTRQQLFFMFSHELCMAA